MLQYMVEMFVNYLTFTLAAIMGYLMAMAKPWLDKRFNKPVVKAIETKEPEDK